MQGRDSNSRQYVVGLSKLIDQRFNLQELKEICFNLNLDFENIPGEIKTAKIQGLISYFERRGDLSQLVLAIKEARPDTIVELPPSEAQASQEKRGRRLYVAAISSAPTEKPTSIFFQIPLVSALLRHKHAVSPAPDRLAEREREVSQAHLLGLVHQVNERDLILSSFDELGSLLRGAFSFLQQANTQGGNLRMGIYSDLVYVDSNQNEEPVIPDEYVNLARRIMVLGGAGHVLATSAVQDALKDTAEFKSLLIKPIGKCEIKYHVRVEVYSLYGQNIGNPAEPKLIAPLQVLQRVFIPPELKCARPMKLNVTLSPDVKYSKLVFKFKNPDIQISSGDGDPDIQISSDNDDKGDDNNDYAFEYQRSDRGQYEKTFHIWASKAEAESLEPVVLRCYDESGGLIAAPFQGRIWLRRRTPPPDSITETIKLPLWLLDRFRCFPWYWKVLFIVALLLAGSLYVNLRYDETQRRGFKEKTLVALHFWPPHYTDRWSDQFLLTADLRPDPAKWKNAPSEWNLGPGGTDAKDKALLVRGETAGLNELQGYGLYDFTADLRMEILPGQRSVSWILRAKDPADFYLFRLTFPPADKTQAILEATIYENGKEVGKLAPGPQEAGFFYPFNEHDLLWVDIEVTDNRFTHTFSFLSGNKPPDPNHPEDDFKVSDNEKATGTVVRFEDKERRYRYGSIGFWAKDPGSNAKIEGVEITNAR